MLAGAFSCHHLNAHRSDEYIVPEASDGDVTDTACPGRILLVEQQVSLPLLLIKTETDIQTTFTSHRASPPEGHKCRYAVDWFWYAEINQA
jgi:hypothetical protein